MSQSQHSKNSRVQLKIGAALQSILIVLALLLVDMVKVEAAAPVLNGAAGWTAVMFGTGKDPQGDSQAGASDTDIIADAAHGSLYVGYSDSGTSAGSDDYLYFRLRIDNPTSSTVFGGVGVVGMDANLDGRIDLFMLVDGRSNGQVVRLMDPGTGANISPSTTTTAALPTGWLANNGVYPFTSQNYNAVAVSSGTDPHWNGDNDLGDDGKTDIFVSWRVPLADLATVLGIPSPVDKNGNYGPRGSTGIAGYDQDTLVRYVSFTQTQTGPINGDLNGVGKDYDKNATFDSLGAYTEPMSASNPVSASDSARITTPVDANGLINAAEGVAFTVNGTATTNGWVMLVISDSGTGSITNWVQAVGTSAWSVNGINLGTLAEGTLTFTATLVTGNNSTTAVANSSGDTTTAIYDITPPVIAVNTLATVGKPVISGTSTDVPAGSVITVSIDPNGDGILTDLITYSAIVDSSGNWSVDTSVVAPTSGTMPSSGLTAYASVTATGADAAGNTFTAEAVTQPKVTAITTNDTTPTITGTWGGSNGGEDTLSVVVNGVTYTQGDGNLVVSGTTWTLTIPPGDALGVGSYNITTTVTRDSVPYSNVTSSALTVVSGPAVSITSASSQPTAKPTITGTSTIVSGFVSLRIDPNNDGNFTDAVYYSVATDGSGNWSLSTASAVPVSGAYPLAGVIGTQGILVTATDGGGVSATASQVLTTSIPTITITSILSTAAADTTGTITNSDFVINRREDDAITVSGTSTSADGLTVTVVVTDGDTGTADPSGTATVASGGAWSVTGLNLSALRNGYITFTASVTGATTSNNSYTHDAAVPVIRFTTPATLDKNAGSVGETVSGASDLAPGSIIAVQYGGNGTVNATVAAGGDWSVTPAFALTGSSVTVTATPDVTATDTAGNKPAAAISQLFNVSASFVPTAGAVVIGTIAGDNIIVDAEASSVTISGTSTLADSTVVTITVTNSLGTQIVSTTATVTSGTWSTSAQNFSAVTPNGPLIVTAKATSTILYTDVVVATLQLGSVGGGAAPSIAITTVGDSNLSASEVNPVTISGTTLNAPNGTTVNITVSDTDGGTLDILGTATVDGSGNWTTTMNLSTLVDGTLTVSASVTVSSQTANDTVTVQKDTTAPTLTIGSGPSAGDSTPVISGTSTGLPVGSTITIEIDADNNGSVDVTYNATVQSGGTWSIDTGVAVPVSGTFPASGLPASSEVVVSATDSAGNAVSMTATSITGISDDNGVSNDDFITNDQTLVFSGKAEPGSSVAISIDSTPVGSPVIADVNGDWSFDYTGTSLGAGVHTIEAVATKSAGVTATASQGFNIDITAPVATISGISGDTGVSSSDYVTTDNTLVYNGSAEANSSVLVTLTNSFGDTIFSSTITSDGSGNWSLDKSGSTLPDGTYTLTVVVTDGAGNTTTTTQVIVIDTSASITLTFNATTSDSTPLITGTTDIEVGRTITVDVDTDNNGSYDISFNTTVQAGGVWSVEVTPALADGVIKVQASGTDTAGNAASAEKLLTIDSAAPVVLITTPIGDGDLDATEDNAVNIGGFTTNVVAGSTITVSITDGSTTIQDTATVAGDGSWALSPINLSSLANGTITITATYVNGSGDSFSDVATVIHDKSGAASIDSISTDTGLISDFITYDNTLTFNGSATASSPVSVTLTNSSNAQVFSVSVNSTVGGSWTYAYGSTLPDGIYTLTVNDGGGDVTQTITIDTVDPTGPAAVDTQTTADTTPTITGTATVGAGETLTVTVNGVTYTVGDGNLTIDGSGNWSLTIPSGNELDMAVSGGGFDGKYTVTATITDTAGNTLSSSSIITISALTPTITAATGGSAISADNFGTGTYVTLTGPIYEEGVSGDVGLGTIILTAPAGFEFATGGPAPTVLVTGSATAADNINNATTGSSLALTAATTSQLTFTVTAESVVPNTLTWQDVRVRPTAGTPLATGDLTVDVTSTSTLTDVTAGTTSLGALAEVPGSLSGYKLTLVSSSIAGGGTDQLTIVLVDQYGNTLTGFSGDKVLTFSGPGTSAGGDVPTVTDKNGTPVNVGSLTTISFVNGVSTAGGLLTGYKAESSTVGASDGTYSTSTTGGSGAALTVTVGAANAYRISAASGTPTAGSTDALTITQVDQYGNTITGLNADVALTFSGLATSTGGNVPTVTDKNGSAINLGSSTTITFANGVATVGGTLVPYAAETATLHVTDGTRSSGAAGGTGAALVVSAGAGNAYRLSAASATPSAGATDVLTITQVDQYGNTVTGLSGDVSLTFSGLATSTGGNVPTVTDKTGTPVNLGSATTITFTGGVATAGGTLVAYAAETATLDVTDGTRSSTDTGGTGATLTISGGVASGYRITAATGTPAAGAGDVLTITQVDQYGNPVTGFSGDVSLTFSGLATSTSGNVPTVTDKTGTPVNLGSPTTITFTGGVGTAGGTLVAYAAETATLQATDGTYSTATAGGSGATLTVSALAASKLGFTTQPDKVEINAAFPQQPVVQTQDIYGNPSTTGLAASLNVTLTLTSGSGTLTGTVTLDIGTGAGNGTVSYTNLQLDTAGPARQLTASATGLTSGLSSLFDVWTVYMASGDVIVADRGPYFSTGTILISRLADPTTAVLITSIKDPYEVAREADGNFLVVDYESRKGGGLFRIDRLTFAVTTVSTGGDFDVPFGVKVEASGQILVADLDAFSQAGAVFRVDPVTGVQTTLTQGDQFYFLQGLAIAPTGTPNAGDIYVTSVGDGASITSKLIQIDPVTGVQTVITEADNLNYPVGMAVEADGKILVVDALAKKVIRVDPAAPPASRQTVLSDAATGAQGIPFLLPTHVALDAAGDLYVSDGKVNAGVNERLLFKVDKTTGNRVLITQDGFFEQPRGLLLVP